MDMLVEGFVGEAHSLKVEKILFKEKSEYQEVMVLEVKHLDYKLFPVDNTREV